MTGTAWNRLTHLLTSALDVSETKLVRLPTATQLLYPHSCQWQGGKETARKSKQGNRINKLVSWTLNFIIGSIMICVRTNSGLSWPSILRTIFQPSRLSSWNRHTCIYTLLFDGSSFFIALNLRAQNVTTFTSQSPTSVLGTISFTILGLCNILRLESLQ